MMNKSYYVIANLDTHSVFQYNGDLVVFDSSEDAHECMKKFNDVFSKYNDDVVVVENIEKDYSIINYRNTPLCKSNTTSKFIIGNDLEVKNNKIKLKDIDIIEAPMLTEYSELIIMYMNKTNNRTNIPYLLGVIDGDNNIEILIPSFNGDITLSE